MKLSGYHKRIGDNVVLKTDYDDFEQFDQVYISKVFTDTPIDESILQKPNVKYGGTGFFYDEAPPLPDEVEHGMPDYHLYDEWVSQKLSEGIKRKDLTYFTDWSIGFATRGCIRGCSFCVNKNYRQCLKHSSISEFLDPSRKYICLLDDNVFACKEWREVFGELQATGKRFQFKQGCDERLLNDEKCDVLFNKSKWIGDYIFAFDRIEDAPTIVKKLQLLRRHTKAIPKFYVFCGYNHENPGKYDVAFWKKDIEDLFKRISVLMHYGCLPYIMRYKDYEQSPWRGVYISVAAWCNQPSMFKKKSYREFASMRPDRERYMMELERAHPVIAIDYYDKKFNDPKNKFTNIA